MRLLFIRHGDPDYEHDSLTPTGKIEADLLAQRMVKEEVTHFYVSPLGRARETAEPTLSALGRTAKVKDWLQEFPATVDVSRSDLLAKTYPNTRKKPDGSFELRRVCWDMVPEMWTKDERYFDPVLWQDAPPAHAGDLKEVYQRVCTGFDELLAQHGYVRDGRIYRTEQGNHETLAFFCHFGLTSILLSHLWNTSPFVLTQGLAMAPTSVTEVFSEEREKGSVYFRASKVGDISHLYIAGRQASFSARFCETFEDETRH